MLIWVARGGNANDFVVETSWHEELDQKEYEEAHQTAT